MTPTEYEHHKEQMEAYRRDFMIAWETTMKPEFERMGLDGRDLALAQMKAWAEWRKTYANNIRTI